MLLNLFLSFLLTPENIIGLILNILTIISLCFIFQSWQEKWWKSLIPVYGTYIMYKHTWKKTPMIFLIPLISDIIGARCMSIAKKTLLGDAFETMSQLLDAEQLTVDVDLNFIILLLTIYCFCVFLSLLFARITYVKICDSLGIKNILLKMGSFFVPELFLFADYIFYKKHKVNFE